MDYSIKEELLESKIKLPEVKIEPPEDLLYDEIDIEDQNIKEEQIETTHDTIGHVSLEPRIEHFVIKEEINIENAWGSTSDELTNQSREMLDYAVKEKLFKPSEVKTETHQDLNNRINIEEYDTKEKTIKNAHSPRSDVDLKQCSVILIQLSVAELLKYRTKKKLRTYNCDLCNFTTMYLSSLRHHKLIHNGVKSYQCDQCSYISNHAGNLNKHKMKHTTEKPYKCDLCNYNCNQLGYLRKHKLKHTSDRPFQCSQCSYTCNRVGLLKQHKLIHSYDKPYVCDLCSYTTNRSGHLKRHKLIHN